MPSLLTSQTATNERFFQRSAVYNSGQKWEPRNGKGTVEAFYGQETTSEHMRRMERELEPRKQDAQASFISMLKVDTVDASKGLRGIMARENRSLQPRVETAVEVSFS